jgi:hypothetical protein
MYLFSGIQKSAVLAEFKMAGLSRDVVTRVIWPGFQEQAYWRLLLCTGCQAAKVTPFRFINPADSAGH